ENVLIKPDEMSLNINSFELRTPLIGIPNAYNVAAAYQCGLSLGIDQRTIKKGLEALKNVPGRFESIDCGQPFSVIVDFAHSPDSLQKLIETYRPLTEGEIILVFGCPGDRDKEKRPIMGKIAVELADKVIVTTDDPHGEDAEKIVKDIVSSLPSPVTSLLDRKKAIEKALKMAKKGDTVLIAGRGHEKFQDVNGKKVALDDREVVRRILTS
ncbi:MAG: UDP-N-acetylmuramoyl-L-alanyl-D-glutamate--2,6-diaminopimelate ligase, partial [Candidatus Margulisbacteria bacterium]|nr:UDP-N-acetylmuramoyl-L-alanyl-D-glutamate--2,6-diaminopimelate ligase [Candidatus Margulisiibacteriota bacterium]